jgi:ABC-2 type transport system ATP-binding protein
MEPVVVARGVTRVFASRFSQASVRALDAFSLDVAAGQFVALVGPNGAGKTTFLEILATLLQPTSGTVRICGHDATTPSLDVRRALAYCPAGQASFWPRLTGTENLTFFAALSGELPRCRALDAAADVGLTPAVMQRQIRSYSDGELQRLALARALMRRVRLWLLDEPTRSLDPAGRSAMWTLIRNRAREHGVAVIAATHDIDGACGVADVTVALA